MVAPTDNERLDKALCLASDIQKRRTLGIHTICDSSQTPCRPRAPEIDRKLAWCVGAVYDRHNARLPGILQICSTGSQNAVDEVMWLR